MSINKKLINPKDKYIGKRLRLRLKNNGVICMENLIQRPCSVLESIEKGFQEIKEFKEGKRKFKSLEESKNMWAKWAEEEDGSR